MTATLGGIFIWLARYLPWFLSFGLFLIFAFLGLRLLFARPFDMLLQLVKRGGYESGRFDRSALSGHDEFGRLGRAILEMAKQLRASTLQSDDRLRQLDELLGAIGEGVILIDLNQRIIKLNNTAKRWSGWYGEAEGRQFSDVIKSLELSKQLSKVCQDFQRERMDITSITGKKKLFVRDLETCILESMPLEGPEARRVKVKIVPIKDAHRGQTILLVYVIDVTEIHQNEQLRREFFANVSHELKTPIAAIRGYAEVLREMRTNIDENTFENFLSIIERNALDLTKLIDEMVTISRLESGELRLDLKPYDLSEAIRRVFETCLPKARKAEVELIADIAEDAVQIQVDNQRFDSVLLNLVDNAVKYNRPGGYVKVSTRLALDDVRIFVEDTGTGIPREAMSRVFERFFRVDKSHNRLGGGTGLGLAITKHVVLAHGGTISVKSELDSGTVFKVTVPLKPHGRKINLLTPL